MSATSVIDSRPPPYRAHVAVKLKKLQKESERSQKIERDNLILLQKLNYIMSTHWVDNYLAPQPTFLSKVGMYRPVDSGIDLDEVLSVEIDDEGILESKTRCRKLNCFACSPHRFQEVVAIPEERVPWEPPKKEVGRRRRSSSVPSKRKPEPLPSIKEKPKSASTSEEAKKSVGAKERPRTTLPKDIFFKERPNSISISRGSLKLSINFPGDAEVKFDENRAGRKPCKCSRGPKLNI